MDLSSKIKSNKPKERVTEGNGNLNRSLEDLSHLLLDAVTSPVIYVSNERKYCFVNKAYADWFHLNANDIIGKSVEDFVGPEVYLQVKPYMEKALRGQHVSFEEKIQYKHRFRFIQANYIPDEDEKGMVKGYIALLKDITALREVEGRYRDLMHSLPAAIYSTDKDGRITLYNEAAVELWGRQPEIGRDMWCGSWKIYEADGVTALPHESCPLAIALKERRRVERKEIIIERPDGSRKNVESYPEPIFDSDGEITGAVNMLFDITYRKIAEAERARLAAIVQTSDDAIVSKGIDGIVTSWNEAAERIFGYTADEMIGASITKIIPADRLDEEPKIIGQLVKGEKIDHFETERIRKDGQRINVSLTISPVKDGHGKVIGISKIARDISKQKKSDETTARLAAIVESSDDAIIGKTLNGTITSWNHAAEQLFGYKEEEIIGESITKLIPTERLAEEDQILARLKNGERVEHFETKRITKNGKILDISLTSSPIKNSHGQVIGASKIVRNITQQKETARLMHESEERFRMAVETTNLGTWEYNPKNLELYCSVESRKICGLPANVDPQLELLLNRIYSEDKNYCMEQVKKAIDPAGDGKFDIHLRFHRYDNNEIRWIRAQGKVFFNSNLFPERLIGTMLDITEEKTQEQELRESVELFQTMADNVPAMIWMSGTDKFNDYFNKTWLEFTGRTLEQETDEGWLESVHPDDVQKCIDTYNASFKEQKGFYTEYRLRRHDGEYRWISDNSVPRISADGEFLGFISASIDIDDQKRFREKIQESELLFKTISNASPAALWMTNEEQENIFVSDTWLKWTGKNFNEVIHRGWMDSVFDDDKESIVSKFRKSFKQKRYFNSEFRFKRTDGELRWGFTEGYPFYDLNGKFSGYAGSITDITEIKKLEQRKDDFIKMASHELKTPITSISGYVQLLLNIYDESDEQRLHFSKATVKSSLTTIAKQVTKLTRLVSELLDLSKIESGKLELHKTEFNLSEVVEETVQDVRHTTAKHAIILHNEFEGKVFADKDRIAQVLLNLLTNAIKYSPNSDHVEVTVEGNRKFATIKVKDSGIGIDKKDQLKIFERFYRVEGKSEQTFPGFGIGLFIASEIIHRHAGNISVESERGKGSMFTVTLPTEKNG